MNGFQGFSNFNKQVEQEPAQAQQSSPVGEQVFKRLAAEMAQGIQARNVAKKSSVDTLWPMGTYTGGKKV